MDKIVTPHSDLFTLTVELAVIIVVRMLVNGVAIANLLYNNYKKQIQALHRNLIQPLHKNLEKQQHDNH